MNKIITIKDYTKKLKLGRPQLDGKAMCANKWTFLYVHFSAGIIRNCYNVPPRVVTKEELETYGTNIFFDHPYELARRQEKLDNVRHSDCSNCWNCEDKGVISQRKSEPFYKAHRSRFGVPVSTKALPTFLELYFSNTCDLKCVYCNDMSSSQWATELKKFNEPALDYIDTTDGKLTEEFYKWFESEGSKDILNYNILGGEPLIQQDFYKFADYLLNTITTSPNRHFIKPELTLFTNGNTPPKYMDKWLALIDQLHEHISIRIDFSNESTHTRSEFIRSNLDWELFEHNVNRTIAASKGKDVRIRFACTQTALSIPTFINFLKWANDLQIQHGIELTFGSNSVVQPSYLSPWNLTEDFKQPVEETIQWIKNNVEHWSEYADYLVTVRDGIGKHNLADLSHIPAFADKMKLRRGLDLIATFPELRDWYKFCCEVAANRH